MKPSGIFLGFDFGTKQIGVAVGQTITQTATPLTCLSAQQGIPRREILTQLIEEWQPQALVVGLALQADGSPSTTSRAAEKFAAQLYQHFQLPIYFIDERLTSVAARAIMKATSTFNQSEDALAAAIILESWLNNKENYAPAFPATG